MVYIGSARSDEKGTYSGGAAGDQKQKSTPDYAGEVSMQVFYVHKKGWIVIRLKDPAQARAMACAMARACNNPNIGYNQADRLGIVKCGTASQQKTNCDCSSLVRVCFQEATGKDPGNFITSNEVKYLEKTGLVEVIPYTKQVPLYLGDILVTKTKGHTVAVTSAPERGEMTDSDLTQTALKVIAGYYGCDPERSQLLRAEGKNPEMVRAEVNRILSLSKKQ